MATIVTEPAAVALAYNPVRFVVSPEVNLEPGAPAEAATVFDVGPEGMDNWEMVLDDSLTLNFNGNAYTFVFKNTTTPTPYELPISTYDSKTVAECLLEFFESNHFIRRNYDLTVNGDYLVRFTAKEKNGRWDVSGDVVSSNYAVWVVDNAINGSAKQFVINRYVRGDLYIEDGDNGNFKFYADIEQRIVDDTSITFDFSSKFRAYFQDKIEIETLAEDGISPLSLTNKRYYVIFTEYDANAYESTGYFVQSNTLRCLKAGIKQDEWEIFQDPINDYLKPKKKLLSWRPSRRTIAPGQRDYLYYFNYNTALNGLRVKATFYYSNDTSETILDVSVPGPDNNTAHAYTLDYDVISAKATIPANETIRGIELWWTDANDAELSESTYFKVVPDHALDRYFFYENSWGVFDVLRTKSRHGYGVDVDSEEVIVGTRGRYNEGGLKQIVNHYTENFSGSTGVIDSLQEALALTDFVISEHRFLKKGARLINVTIKGGTYRAFEDDAYPYGFAFNYKRAEEQQKFSELISVGLGGEHTIEEDDEVNVGFEPL